MSTPTLEDALHAVRKLREERETVGSKIILDFLEKLHAMTDDGRNVQPSPPRPERDWYIIDGAYQKGFENIDDDASLLVVHTHDLMNFVNLYRTTPADEALDHE